MSSATHTHNRCRRTTSSEEEVKGEGDHGGRRPSQRFEAVYTQLTMNNAQQCLIRLNALRRTALDRMYRAGVGLVLMAELALLGPLPLLPEVLMYRRWSAQPFTAMASSVERHRVYNPRATKPIWFYRSRRNLDYLMSVGRAPIHPGRSSAPSEPSSRLLQ